VFDNVKRLEAEVEEAVARDDFDTAVGMRCDCMQHHHTLVWLSQAQLDESVKQLADQIISLGFSLDELREHVPAAPEPPLELANAGDAASVVLDNTEVPEGVEPPSESGA
jgi:hypothetical protein